MIQKRLNFDTRVVHDNIVFRKSKFFRVQNAKEIIVCSLDLSEEQAQRLGVVHFIKDIVFSQ